MVKFSSRRYGGVLLGLGLVCCFGFFLLHDNTCKDYFMGILIVINDFGSCTPF